MIKCVFFDRDGIVNRSPGRGYVERWEDFRLEPSFPNALRTVRDRGYGAVVVTNQRAVSLGIMTRGDVDAIHAKLRQLLQEDHGLELLDILYCPHSDGECDCRKPQPGMLLAAARRHGISLGDSWMVGDQERDVEAGICAGCRTVLVSAAPGDTRADHVVCDVKDLDALLARVLLPA